MMNQDLNGTFSSLEKEVEYLDLSGRDLNQYLDELLNNKDGNLEEIDPRDISTVGIVFS